MVWTLVRGSGVQIRGIQMVPIKMDRGSALGGSRVPTWGGSRGLLQGACIMARG